MEHASNLNESSVARPVRVIAVSSGKGGVGKTNVSINLATALSNKGQSVMLMDADLGLGNVDILLGIKPKYNLSHVINGEKSLDEVIVKGPSDILIVPASSGVRHMARLSSTEHAGLIRAFNDYPGDIDTLIVDTAAGITDSVISFSKAASDIIVIVCDEPASLTDAYALVKVMSRDCGVTKFRVLTNMIQSAAHGSELFNKLLNVADKFLDVSLDHIGNIPNDEYLRKAVQKQWAVVNAFPRSRSAMAFMRVANLISSWPVPDVAGGHLEFFFERLLPQEEGRA